MIRRFAVALVVIFMVMVSVASADPRQVVSTLGVAGSGDGELSAPTGGVAVRQGNGDIYVVDAGADRVQRFDAAGAYQAQFGASGTGDGQFTFAGNPGGVAIDQSDGSVYVADTGNNRVQKFSAAGAYQSQFGTPGSGDGEFASPIAVAVDPTSHKVFVADRDNNRIQRFSAAGVYEAQFGVAGSGYGELSAPTGVAIDSTGAVYVLDSGNARVQKYTNSGGFQGVFAPATLNLSPQALAVDAATDHVFVSQFTPDFSGTQILELTSAGNTVETHGTALPTPGGIDVRSSSGAISSTDNGGSRVLTLNTAIAVDAAVTAPTAVSPTSATLNGTINAHDGQPVTYHFETSTDQATWTATADAGPISGNSDTPVTADVTGLEPNTQYYTRLVATPTLNPATISSETSYTTLALAPTIDITVAKDIAADEARLTGTVNPNGSTTSYWFEYGATTAYGDSLPAAQNADAGNGRSAAPVTQTLSGLQPETVYHYRLVAHNSAGTTVGSDRRLTTRSTAPPSSKADCEGDPSACRAYELVSPPDKGGNAVLPSELVGVRASPDGERLAFISPAPLPGSESGPRYAVYLASRSHDGWATRGLAPPQDNQYGLFSTAVGGVSQDLKQSLVWSRRALAPGAREGDANIYLQNNLTAERRFVVGSANEEFWNADLSNSTSNFFRAASDDFRHVIVSAYVAPLTADTPPALGMIHTYDIADGAIRSVGIEPDGSPLAADYPIDRVIDVPTSHSISTDGRRVFFGTFDQLFMREDGLRTVEISKSQRTDDPGEHHTATFEGASADGTAVFFADDARLVDDAPAAPDPTQIPYRLYRYVDGRLDELATTAVRPIDGLAKPSAVLNVSDDGRTVYFGTRSALSPAGVDSPPHLYVWREGEGVRDVAQFDRAHDTSGIPGGENGASKWSMTADGRYLAFQSLSRLTDQETRDPDCNAARCPAVYLYDAVTDRLRCVSCDPQGGESSPAKLGGASTSTGPGLGRYYPRAVLDDGTVFFDTPDRLTVGDTDGKLDAYAWRDGTLSLITPGTVTDATFGDVSADGTSVFFLTEDRLVGQDVDDDRDVYVARIGGGIASQNPAPPPPSCVGDVCQGKAPAIDVGSSIAGSATVTGPGDGPLPRRAAQARSVRVLTKAVRGSRFAIAVRVPVAGKLTLSGRGVRTGSRAVARAGTYRVPLTLTDAARHRLKRDHTLKLKLRTAYARRSGATSTTTVTVTVKAR